MASPINLTNIGKSSSDKEIYTILKQNWYKSQPYGFAFYDKEQKSEKTPKSTIYLPISPSNIQISTNMATNIITTLYGIVEEHSEVRYYDIVIQGTTGFSPRFVDEIKPVIKGNKKLENESTGRAFFKSDDKIDLGGFLPEVTNTIKQVAKIASEISNGGAVTNKTGVSIDKTGYVAFHKLYQFFLKYKKDLAGTNAGSGDSLSTFAGNIAAGALSNAAGQFGPAPNPNKPKSGRQVHPLRFLNYKDGVKYDCIPVSFNMSRSADNPMLYNYSIRLRAFNMRGVNAPDSEQSALSRLGLGSAKDQTLFSQLTGVAGNAATLISGIL